MRLLKHINEEYIDTDSIPVEKIQKECKMAINLYKKVGSPFYRGITYTFNVPYSKISVRKNRKPRDMDVESQKYMDKLFLDKFGWKPRSQGLFCVADSKIASRYGNVGVVIPVGAFKYLWSSDIKDLFMGIESRDALWSNIQRTFWYLFGKDKTEKEYFNDMVDSYTNTNIEKYFKRYKKHEIMIQCDEYYVIEKSTWDYYLKDVI